MGDRNSKFDKITKSSKEYKVGFSESTGSSWDGYKFLIKRKEKLGQTDVIIKVKTHGGELGWKESKDKCSSVEDVSDGVKLTYYFIYESKKHVLVMYFLKSKDPAIKSTFFLYFIWHEGDVTPEMVHGNDFTHESTAGGGRD